jgi:prefoldin subunit 5
MIMRNVKHSCGLRAKLTRALFGLLCLVVVAGLSPAFGQSIKAIEDELREVEAELADVDEDRDTMSALEEGLKSGKLVLVGTGMYGYIPVTVEQYTQYLLMRLLRGDITRANLKRELSNLSTQRRAYLERFNELQKEFEARATRLKDRRSYLINERARLSESASVSLAGRWDGSDWGEVTIRGGGGSYEGNYSTTFVSGKLGYFSFRKAGDGSYTGEWRDPDGKHGGTLDRMDVSPDGNTIYIRWSSTDGRNLQGRPSTWRRKTR